METTPWASASAVSTESVSRCLTLGLTASRSTMTSIECLYFLSNVGGSVSCTSSPSTPGQLPEDLDVLPLAAPHHGSEHLESGTLRQPQQSIHDLLGRLPADRFATYGAVRAACPRVEQAEEVIDLRDGAHRRARVTARGLLIDRHRRREALNEVDIRLVHLAQELTRVGRQGLDVAALSFREDRVEREARLARSRQPGEHD